MTSVTTRKWEIVPRGHDLRGGGADRAHGNVNTENDDDQSEDTANSAVHDVPTTPAIDLPPIDGDLPALTREQERAIMEAMLKEASEEWEEAFGTEFGFPDTSQDDGPKSAP